jgi:hypothetical protein
MDTEANARDDSIDSMLLHLRVLVIADFDPNLNYGSNAAILSRGTEAFRFAWRPALRV